MILVDCVKHCANVRRGNLLPTCPVSVALPSFGGNEVVKCPDVDNTSTTSNIRAATARPKPAPMRD